MKNAHARFGRLEFTRQMRDTTTEVHLAMDRFIGEADENGRTGKAHLASILGGDQDVGAVWAGVVENAFFTVSGPDLQPMKVTFGEGAQCFRGTVSTAGRKRPVRHLVIVSAEIAGKVPVDAKIIRTILCDSDPAFVVRRLAEQMGLPVVPEWAGWLLGELERCQAVVSLIGIGCRPLAVRASKKALLKWIGRAVKQGTFRFPEQNGPITWNVANNFLRPGKEESGEALAENVDIR